MNNRQIYPDLAEAGGEGKIKKKKTTKHRTCSMQSVKETIKKTWSLVPNTKETSSKINKKKRRRKMLVFINANPNLLLPWCTPFS